MTDFLMCQCYSHCQGLTDPMQLGSNVETIDAKHTPKEMRGKPFHLTEEVWRKERPVLPPQVQNGLRESEKGDWPGVL